MLRQLPRLATGVAAGCVVAGGVASCRRESREAAVRQTLTSVSSNVHVAEWATDHTKCGIAKPFSVRKTVLHGGRQEGVDLITVDNGVLSFTVCPTRGMAIGRLDVADRVKGQDWPLGWKSPVRELVHPREVDLQDKKGLGWLSGFNEWLTRCGVAHSGHPGEDGGQLLTLHGRIGNIPASEVEVEVDASPPHTIRVRGRVDEQMFKFADFELWTEASTVPGSSELTIRDVLVNRADYAREYQMIYHTNFGPPLLEAGSEFVAPVAKVAPFNERAAAEWRGGASWRTYLGPTRDYGETVYCVTPHAVPDAKGGVAVGAPGETQVGETRVGGTQVALLNASGTKGIALRYSALTLPSFTLWKNTDTSREGYVTGLEPGTGFAYTRATERACGRVPTLGPGEHVAFSLAWRVLHDAEDVRAVRSEIERIQDGRTTEASKELGSAAGARP